MNSKKHDLTISLLSSGRGDTIERCLSSLAPFKEQLDTEIIVVDTDPDHNEDVMSILKKYADYIIPFEWCNDFAAARNVGLEAANGEWFMFIDDDEWFIDATPLIAFFDSKDAKSCDAVSYRIRNFSDMNFKRYADTFATRLARVHRSTHFAGKVHEYITPIKEHERVVEALVGHTGYIYNTEEEYEDHFNRNIRLLEEMIAKEPNQIRWIVQLLAEYDNINDKFDDAMELARRGYKIAYKNKNYPSACLRGLFASVIIHKYRKAGNYKKCYEEYKKFHNNKTTYGKVSKAFMEFEAGQASYNLGLSKKSKKHFKNYLEAYAKLHDAPAEYPQDYIYIMMYTFKDYKYDYARIFLIKIDIEDGSWEEFTRSFSNIKWKLHDTDINGTYEKWLISAAVRQSYSPNFSEMISTFWKYAHSRKIVQSLLLELKKHEDESLYWNLVQAVAEAEISTGRPIDVKIIWDDRCGKRDNMSDYFTSLFSAVNPLMLDTDLLKIGMRRGAVLDDRIREIPFPRWQHCVDEFLEEKGVDEIKEMQSIMDEIYLGMPDEYYAYFAGRANETLEAIAESNQKIQVYFLPYKASMWDSMESVWLNTVEDVGCVAHVVPIPYYDRLPDGNYEFRYDGDLFPEEVSIENYKNVSLEKIHPDVVYIHNPYDDMNLVTKVHSDYFSSKLKDVTDCLVYIPYYISGTIKNDSEMQRHVLVPGAVNADITILQSKLHYDYCKKNNLKGVSSGKYYVAGSPKFDAMLRYQSLNDIEAIKYELNINTKKVILFNTSIKSLLEDTESWIKRFDEVIKSVENKDITLIWRPHPLLKATIKSMRPRFWNYYQSLEERIGQQENICYDTSADPLRALHISDGLITDYSSLVFQFYITGKPLYSLDADRKWRKKNKMYLPFDYLDSYLMKNDDMSISEFVSMIEDGRDDRFESRQSTIEHYMYQADGKAGERIHQYVMKRVMQAP